MRISSRLPSRSTAAFTGVALLALLASFLPATNGSAQTGSATTKTIVTLTGLRITDTTVGAGASPRAGQTCVINYTTWVYANGAKGAKLESSLDSGQPLTYVCGKGQVRREWDEGIATMKVGGKRTIIAPLQAGAAPPVESGNVNGQPQSLGFIYEIELLEVK
jgi:peptidylprolyl isomerase